MSSAVLDASAVLAFVHGEPGAAVAQRAIPGGRMGAVNWSEVALKVLRSGKPWEPVRTALLGAGLQVEGFTAHDAEIAAALAVENPGRGLSLADRACLALGRRLRLPVITADRSWKGVPGVKVQVLS